MPKNTNIVSSSLIISFSDLGVSLFSTIIYASFGEPGREGDLLTCFSVYPSAFLSLGRWFGSLLALLFYLSLALLCQASVFSYLKAVCHPLCKKRGLEEGKVAALLSTVSCLFGVFLVGKKGISRLLFIDGKIMPILILATGLFEAIIFVKIRKSLLPEIKGGFHGLSLALFRLSLGFLTPLVIFILILLKIFF